MHNIINNPVPDNTLISSDYTVKIKPVGETDYTELECYRAIVRDWHLDQTVYDENMTFCYFDFDFTQPLKIWVQPHLYNSENAEIRPKNENIEFEQDDSGIYFTVDRPVNLSVEFGGDIYHNLFIFANLNYSEIPNSYAENVIYFSAGVHDVGQMRLYSNQTVFIDSGAVVYGSFLCEDSENVKIMGHGILHGEKLEHDIVEKRFQMIRFERCKNISVEGIILIDSPSWAMTAYESRNIEIRGIREICYNANSDGIDICGCENVFIENVFLRNHDDNISIKSYGSDNRNIVMKNSVLWNDRAHSMLVGPESKKENRNVFEDIHFENITILEHKEFAPAFMGVMAIMCSDNALFKNISWKHINIERLSYGRLLSIKYNTEFASTIGHGIRDVIVEDVKYQGPILYKNLIHGIDSQHTTERITIKDFVVNNFPQKDGSHLFDVNPFVHKITYND